MISIELFVANQTMITVFDFIRSFFLCSNVYGVAIYYLMFDEQWERQLEKRKLKRHCFGYLFTLLN